MSNETTPNLILPYIMASQAQKHVTHNEALRRLDAVVQIALADRDLAAPPATPADGDRYLVAAAPTGDWAGHEGEIAAFQDGAWAFLAPALGWLAWIADEERLLAFDGAAWVQTVGAGPLQSLAMLGVNAVADAANRLAVKADAALFSHDDVTPGSGDMRLVLNKAASGGTASYLFQTGWSGRAEIGTSGSDHLAVKVSPNGSSWTTAMQIDNATGNVGVGTTPGTSRLDVGTGGIRGAQITLDRPAGNVLELHYRRATAARWVVGVSSAAESGSDVGSDFFINRFGDGGAYISTPFSINRATGALGLFGDARAFGIRGAADNTYSLGNASARWSQVWAANGTIQTSDARDKTEVEPIRGDVALALVAAIDPVSFRWVEGGREVVGIDQATGEPLSAPRPGRRRHAGFLAQDVRAALADAELDLGVWGLDDPDDGSSRQWLRPDQMIAILWAAVRELRRT